MNLKIKKLLIIKKGNLINNCSSNIVIQKSPFPRKMIGAIFIIVSPHPGRMALGGKGGGGSSLFRFIAME